MKATTLDGYRLAHTECEVTKRVGARKFLVPSTSLSAIKDEFIGDVVITIGSKVVSFMSGGVKFMIRRLEGEYIKYAKIVPAEFKQRLRAHEKNLMDCSESWKPL